MQKITIKDVKSVVSSGNEKEIASLLKELENDGRAGIKKIVDSYFRKLETLENKKKIFENKKQFDFSYTDNEKLLIGGIDEAGRGPLAGEVVASCVILKQDFNNFDIDDSKKITENKRENLYDEIMQKAISVGVGIASVFEIDNLNILEATKLAMRRAVESMAVKPDILLIDALNIDLNNKQENIIKGDEKSLVIGAASIVAKVTRDRMIKKLDLKYPKYEFAKHKGYGTKMHVDAIRSYGIINGVHRRKFVCGI